MGESTSRNLTIAHNGNLSNGRMFPIIEPGTGRKIDREYAETRMSVYQITDRGALLQANWGGVTYLPDSELNALKP